MAFQQDNKTPVVGEKPLPSYPSTTASPMAYSNLPEVSSGNDAPELAPVGHGQNSYYHMKSSPEVVPQTLDAHSIKHEYPQSVYTHQYSGASPYTSPGPQNSALYYPPPSAVGPAPSQIFPAEEQKKGNVVIKRRTCIIIGIVLAILVIGAIVGGAVGGVMASRNREAAQSDSAGTSPGGNNGGGNGNNGTSGNNNNGDSPGAASPKNAKAILIEQSPISAVSYTVDGVDYKMVFWQPQSSPGDIKYSAWDSVDKKWQVVDLKSKLQGSAKIGAMPGTTIATAVRPGDTKSGGGGFTLSVIYINPDAGVEELRTTDVKGDSWEKMSYTIFAKPRSQIAARWDVCPSKLCTGDLNVAYENDGSKIRMHYPHVPDLKQDMNQDVQRDMRTGSGIALTAISLNKTHPDVSSIKLYYQGSDRLLESTRQPNFAWGSSVTNPSDQLIPTNSPPQTYATSFENGSSGLTLNLAVIQRYPNGGRLTITHWNDKAWSNFKEPRVSKPTAGVTLESRTSAVSLSSDMKAYVVPENCESIFIFDLSKDDPTLWNPTGEVTIK